jgi:hypothetical protein
MSMYAVLAAYRKEHGHCRVPRDSGSSLANWVSRQRVARRQGKSSDQDISRLDDLDFVWDWQEDRWEEMFAALMRYKAVHGDCHVPTPCYDNRRLGYWVVRQRTFNAKGKLRPDRIERLTALGFRWS